VEDSPVYPSVTTVLSKKSAEGIKAWRKRVGEAKAQAITTKAARRGTKAHLLIEDYILGEDTHDDDRIMPEDRELANKLKVAANKSIDNIRVVEGQMMSDFLRVAGTVDCIAEYNGRLAVIDWKTSAREKKKEWVDGYFMQAAAYAVMFEENTGIPIDTLVVVIAHDESYEPQIFVEKRDDWIHEFIKYREQYTA